MCPSCRHLSSHVFTYSMQAGRSENIRIHAKQYCKERRQPGWTHWDVKCGVFVSFLHEILNQLKWIKWTISLCTRDLRQYHICTYVHTYVLPQLIPLGMNVLQSPQQNTQEAAMRNIFKDNSLKLIIEANHKITLSRHNSGSCGRWVQAICETKQHTPLNTWRKQLFHTVTLTLTFDQQSSTLHSLS